MCISRGPSSEGYSSGGFRGLSTQDLVIGTNINSGVTPIKFTNLNKKGASKSTNCISHHRFAYAKTKTQISFAVTAKLISAFILATQIVQSLYFLNPKFQASIHLLWLNSLVVVGPGRKPEHWFSHNEAQMWLVTG